LATWTKGPLVVGSMLMQWGTAAASMHRCMHAIRDLTRHTTDACQSL
jgi:hypothetical protein